MRPPRITRLWSIIAFPFFVLPIVAACSTTNYDSYEQIAFELSQSGIECEYEWSEAEWPFQEIPATVSSGECLATEIISGRFEWTRAAVFSGAGELKSVVQRSVDDHFQIFEDTDFEAAGYNPCETYFISGIGDQILVGNNWMVKADSSASLEIFKDILGGEILTEFELCERES